MEGMKVLKEVEGWRVGGMKRVGQTGKGGDSGIGGRRRRRRKRRQLKAVRTRRRPAKKKRKQEVGRTAGGRDETTKIEK